ncbi:MAG: hypothetical protein R3E08_03470 [Thiotrichaceae bacterium]
MLQKLPAEHFKNIDTKEIQALSDKDLGKVLVNLDANQIKPQDVKGRLPKDWEKLTTKGASLRQRYPC